MTRNRIALSAALLATTGLVPAGAAWAQEGESASVQTDDVIVVRYQYVPDSKRVTSEVASFLSADDFITTGDSDIADAMSRVTGVTISNGRFPVVRGLNERYSNTLINGSPLASPEPLLRAAPLDLVPTSIVRNVLVQKTFTPQYTAEFGGGLVEIETSSLPNEGFFDIGVSGSVNTESSFDEGLLHDGGSHDEWGFGDGTRDIPGDFQELFQTQRIGAQDADTLAEFGRSLENSKLWVVQQGDVPGDVGAEFAAGERFDFDNMSLGLQVAASYDNEWRNRFGERGDVTGQLNTAGELEAVVNTDYERYSTINDITANGLIGAGFEFGDQQIEALALVLRSTEKETRVELGNLIPTEDEEFRDDNTEFFERQVYTYQVRGDHVFDALGGLEADWRWSFSDASREAPNQRRSRYEGQPEGADLTCLPFDPTPEVSNCILREDTRGNEIRFSRVDEEVSDYGFDLALPVDAFGLAWEWKAGYAYLERERVAYSRALAFAGASTNDFRSARVDYIFADPNIGPRAEGGTWEIRERGASGAADAYAGELEVDAAYIQADVELGPFLRAALGGRFEDATQSTRTFNVDTPDSTIVSNEEDYFLPAATLTWTFADNMQARFGYSQTIARPQFRELGFALFADTELDQRFRGNPFLVDTEIDNYDARYEWYFGRDEFFTIGAFYKQLENPILETLASAAEEPTTTFLNAPEADLYGFEVEFEKRFDFSERFANTNFLGDFWDNAEFFVNTNYTYSTSEVSVSDGDTVILPQAGSPVQADLRDADGVIKDGTRLQGQSDHIVNLQLGWEDVNAGTRTALLINWSSERLRTTQFDVATDANGDATAFFPEVEEQLPLQLDLVHSRRFEVGNTGEVTARFAIRNILGEDYEATQSVGGEEFVFDRYDLGTTFSFSLSKSF